jgi:hypothetical protein
VVVPRLDDLLIELNETLVKPKTLFFTILLALMPLLWINGQVVFSDDFTDYTDPNWTTSGNLSGSVWDVYRSGVDFGARRNDSPSQLEITNDIGGSNNVNGYGMVVTPTTAFTSPYSTVLSSGGVVTWTFNMRQPRTDPSGFDGGNYGSAFILAGQSATSNTTGDGYAVVLGQSGSTDPLRLVRYTTGISGNAGLTNIIASNTTGLNDFGTEYLSIKVTYNPCLGGLWELFVRNDGATAFADPLSGTLTSQGTAMDNTYTGLALEMMAAYWNCSTAAGQTAFFNNVTVSVVPIPSVTLGPNPVVCSGITSANLTYSNLTGGANQYDLNWSSDANMEGFTDLFGAALPSSPMVLTLPEDAVPGLYTAVLSVINSTTMCESALYPISVTINPLPVVGCPNDTAVCSNTPAFTLSGATPSGGTYTGPGVMAGMFNPGTAPPGLNVISYTYTDMNACSNTCSFDITVNTAPTANAGSYGPACLDDADIMLNGMPSGGIWSGTGVTGNFFDPSYGTQTLTYTYTDMNGCMDSDQTTITVSSCADPSTMQWILLQDGLQYGTCTSNSDCDQNIICYGLEYTPLYSGVLTSYTTGFFMDCDNGSNPVVSNMSCVMTDNSNTLNFCAQVDSILFNSSGNSGGLSITMGVPVIIHQVCFTIPSSGVMIITRDNTLGLSASIDLTGGGFETDEIAFYTPYVVDSLIDCAILPLRWLSFSAVAEDDFVSRLDWFTADEINNSHFEIQRSQGPDDPFVTIGRVEADEVVRSVHGYSFVDEQARPGKNYYRIKQVDFDGQYQYSSIRTVSFKQSDLLVDAWPNPARETLMVDLFGIHSGGRISMVDLAGRVIYHEAFEAGQTRREIELGSFTDGMYTLLVQSGELHHVQKIIIAK